MPVALALENAAFVPRSISTAAKSESLGFVHLRVARRSPPLPVSPVGLAGGVFSVGGGSAGGVVPGAGFGRIVSLASALVLFPLASVAVKCTVVVPTGKSSGVSVTSVGCGSAMSLT